MQTKLKLKTKNLSEQELEIFEQLTLLTNGLINELKISPIASLVSATAIADTIFIFDNSIECIEIVKFMIPE